MTSSSTFQTIKISLFVAALSQHSCLANAGITADKGLRHARNLRITFENIHELIDDKRLRVLSKTSLWIDLELRVCLGVHFVQ